MAKAKQASPKKPVSKPATAKPAPKAVSRPTPAGPAPSFNIDEINQLIHALNHSNVSKLKLERGDFKITIRQGGEWMAKAPVQVISAQAPIAAAPAPHQPVAAAPVAAAPPAVAAADHGSENLHTIKSPMIGTFYRSPGPGKPVFVNVGDDIKAGDVLCIVEAMKLFNEIESEVSGKVVKVLVDDTSPVEYDQPLFLVQLS